MTTRETDMSILLDSNIVLYAFGNKDAKKTVAITLLKGHPRISIQVSNECCLCFPRKAQWPPAQIAIELETLLRLARLNAIASRRCAPPGHSPNGRVNERR